MRIKERLTATIDRIRKSEATVPVMAATSSLLEIAAGVTLIVDRHPFLGGVVCIAGVIQGHALMKGRLSHNR